jgi:hypothetical protein
MVRRLRTETPRGVGGSHHQTGNTRPTIAGGNMTKEALRELTLDELMA